MDLVTNQAFELKVLNALKAVGAPLTGAKLDLYTNDIIPGRDLPRSAYVTANFDGYAQAAITWLGASVADDGTVEVIGTVPEFRPTGSVTPNNVFGVVVTDAAGDLIGAARLDDAPTPLGSTLNNLLVTVRIKPTVKGFVLDVT